MRQAILRGNPDKGLIFYSDPGIQHARKDFKVLLAENEFVGSMGRRGGCWDNAVAESFIHTLKVDLIYRIKFRTREEGR